VTVQAGFAEVDITPPLGTHKIGWLRDIVSTEVHDPLFARVVVFRTPQEQVAFVQLDTLFVAWPEVAAIRQGVSQQYGFPGNHVMVTATHNHAGPAVTHAGDVPKDAVYADWLVSRVVDAFGHAVEDLDEAEVGWGRCFEWSVAHNRRVVMRDGTVRTHGTFADLDALCMEGPVDPELAVLAVRSMASKLRGLIVNFSCHPTHHGGDTILSAGFPGVLAQEMNHCATESVLDHGPVTLFLNGACGNLHTTDPRTGANPSQEQVGQTLARDVIGVLQGVQYERDVRLGAASRVVELPYRVVTEDEVRGRTRGAQRFIDPAIYERAIPALVRTIQERKTHRIEIQALALGAIVVVSVPGEYFAESGLWIKERAYPTSALVATNANGRVGYIPTREAFLRGGYETTFGPASMLAPEAGEQIAVTAVDLIKSLES
jgi:neutral ceramidase